MIQITPPTNLADDTDSSLSVDRPLLTIKPKMMHLFLKKIQIMAQLGNLGQSLATY